MIQYKNKKKNFTKAESFYWKPGKIGSDES